MRKALTKNERKTWYFVDGKKIYGTPRDLWGDVSDLRGDVSGLRGDVSDLWGDVNDCDLTDEERAKGIDVKDLVLDQQAGELA